MPLFEKIAKFMNDIFGGLEIIIIVSIIIVVITTAISYIKPRIVAKKEREYYKSKLSDKYKNISNKDRHELCECLICLEQAYIEGDKALKNSIYAKGDMEINLLVKAMVPDMLRKNYEDKFQIELCDKYLDLDIEYLQMYM